MKREKWVLKRGINRDESILSSMHKHGGFVVFDINLDGVLVLNFKNWLRTNE